MHYLINTIKFHIIQSVAIIRNKKQLTHAKANMLNTGSGIYFLLVYGQKEISSSKVRIVDSQ